MQNEETVSARLVTERRFDGSNFSSPSSPAVRWAVFVALALIAFAVRLPLLGERPMHTDEAVNAYITGELLAGDGFHYDPRDRHGPVLYLLAKPVAQLFGAKDFAALTETELRLTPAIVGSATVLLFGAGVEMFGFITCLVAALLFVVAPLPVYYSRYFIHETLFVAVTLGLMLSGWRAWNRHSVWAAAAAGLCAALLAGCKETCMIHFFAFAVAGAAGFGWNRRAWQSPSFDSTRRVASVESGVLPPHSPWKCLAVGAGVFVVVTILLFTWFGRNWEALADLGRVAPHLVARAAGQGHEKWFGYYIPLLDPNFVFFLLAGVGVYAAVRNAVTGTRTAGVLLAVYAVTVFAIYSAIPYKTPWLALNLWLPLALLCGLGVQGLWARLEGAAGRWIAAIACAALLAILGERTKTLVFDQPADEKNPLAYAHTVGDLLRLPPRLEQLAKAENLTQPLIAVAAADPWPLPWYLRKFPRVGYWQPGQDPGAADFYLTTPAAAKGLDEQLNGRRPEFFGVRPEAVLILWPPKEAAP